MGRADDPAAPTGQVGSLPGGPNTTAASSRIRAGTGTKIEPYWLDAPRIWGDPRTSFVVDEPPICSARAASSGSRSAGTSVRTVAPTASSREGRLNRRPAPTARFRSAMRTSC